MITLSRRRLLAAAAVVLGGAAGGSAGLVVARPRRRATPVEVRRSAVLEGALARERDLLARLDETTRTEPLLRQRVAVLRRDHAAHAAAIVALLAGQGVVVAATGDGAARSAGASGSSVTAPASTSASAPAPSRPIPFTTVGQLVASEQAMARGAGADSAALTTAAAAVLASIHACETVHAAWLP